MQQSLLYLPSEAKIMSEANNSQFLREQQSLLYLPSEAKIISEANNSQFSIYKVYMPPSILPKASHLLYSSQHT